VISRRGVVCLAIPISMMSFSCRHTVQRKPVEVADVPLYGDELRKQELNPPGSAETMLGGKGYYVRWSPRRDLAAVTTDASGYYRTVNIWDARAQHLSPLISIEDGDPGSGRAYRYAWSSDGKALLVYGHGRLVDGTNNETDERTRVCLVYLAAEDSLYRIFPCKGTRWAFG
jgi:hypothetical protein